MSCSSFSADVDTSDFRASGQVSVSVTCTTSLSDLGLVGWVSLPHIEADAYC